jgi:uncharacterized protein YbjT (DUF2867 family)
MHAVRVQLSLTYTMTTPIAFTGVTGALGKLVVGQLNESVALRFLSRDPSRCPTNGQANRQAVQAFYSNDQQTVEALQGCEVLYMVSAAEDAKRLDAHYGMIDAACKAGVRHVVYTSFFGAAPEAEFRLARDHFHTEEYIKEKGLRYTFVRNNLYADVLASFGPAIKGPAGEGKLCPVSRLDVARSIAVILSGGSIDSHADKTYILTGSQSLTLGDVAEKLTGACKASKDTSKKGQVYTFEQETMEQARASRTSHDTPAWMVEAWISTYTAIAKGEMDGMTNDVEQLTGSPAESFDQYVRRWASDVDS